jgi:hypothetical protein
MEKDIRGIFNSTLPVDGAATEEVKVSRAKKVQARRSKGKNLF